MNQVAKKKAAAKKRSKRAAPKRAAKKNARKVAPKRAAKKAVRKAVAKKLARKAAPKRAKKAVRRAAAKKAAPKRVKKAVRQAAAKKPSRKAPPKRAVRRTAAPVSFPQRQGASVKLALLFEMARARTALLAAVQGLVPGSAERPHAEGKWNTRQHVLHLAHCDQVYAVDLEIARRGGIPDAVGHTREDDDRVNAQALQRMDPLSWDEALRLLHSARKALFQVVDTIAESEPVWSDTHLCVRILRSAALHDRHHADAIKRWRTESNT